VEPKRGSKIFMLGWDTPLEWKYSYGTFSGATNLEIMIPPELQDESKRPCKLAWSFKITPAQN
jgi:hypothetical protein